MLYPGQQVVCVMDDPTAHPDRARRPVPSPSVGQVYTISEVCVPGAVPNCQLKELAVFVDEIPRTCERYGAFEFAHSARCFRPLDKHETDISIFTKMLTDTSAKIDA